MSVQEISAQEMQAILGENNSVQLIDVRSNADYQRYHVPGAVSMPLDTLSSASSKLDSQQPVYVVCASGYRSLKGAQVLLEQGFPKVVSVAEGTEGWKRQALPLVRG